MGLEEMGGKGGISHHSYKTIGGISPIYNRGVHSPRFLNSSEHNKGPLVQFFRHILFLGSQRDKGGWLGEKNEQAGHFSFLNRRR